MPSNSRRTVSPFPSPPQPRSICSFQAAPLLFSPLPLTAAKSWRLETEQQPRRRGRDVIHRRISRQTFMEIGRRDGSGTKRNRGPLPPPSYDKSLVFLRDRDSLLPVLRPRFVRKKGLRGRCFSFLSFLRLPEIWELSLSNRGRLTRLKGNSLQFQQFLSTRRAGNIFEDRIRLDWYFCRNVEQLELVQEARREVLSFSLPFDQRYRHFLDVQSFIV